MTQDQVALGMLHRQVRYKPRIQWDIFRVGVYGNFSQHFPGAFKNQVTDYVFRLKTNTPGYENMTSVQAKDSLRCVE